MKILTAYFSVSGNTKQKAEKIAEFSGSDLFEIKPLVPYTKEDLDYFNPRSRTSLEAESISSRPEIAEKLENMDDYDLIFLGFPIWWYTAPRIILTFLQSYDFTGKTIIPFATASTSGYGNTNSILKRIGKGANFSEGTMLSKSSDKDIENWLNKLI
ncbi:MAG: flavodoxin [Clostridia bacterium]|nr:flavodoxin [Clostridia bacterium]